MRRTKPKNKKKGSARKKSTRTTKKCTKTKKRTEKKVKRTVRKKVTKENVRRRKATPRKKQVRTKRELPPKVVQCRDLGYRYTNNAARWIILELYDDSSLEEIFERIELDMLSTFGDDVDYFLPIYCERIKEKNICITLFDGYVFVMEKETTHSALSEMRSEYLRGPLVAHNEIQYVQSANIDEFKKKLERKIKAMIPRKGQHVIPKVGVFKNLRGKVLSVDRKKLVANVLFEKTTRVVEAPVSVINLSFGNLETT